MDKRGDINWMSAVLILLIIIISIFAFKQLGGFEALSGRNQIVFLSDLFYNKTQINIMLNDLLNLINSLNQTIQDLKGKIESLNETLQTHKHKCHIFVGYSGRIATGITGQTSVFYLNLTQALGETRKIIAVSVRGVRTSGSGILYAYPNENLAYPLAIGHSSFESTIIIKYGTNRLALSMSASTDVWDIYCYGYVVEDFC